MGELTCWVIINDRVFHKKGVPRLTEHDGITGAPMVKLSRGPACLKSGPGSNGNRFLICMRRVPKKCKQSVLKLVSSISSIGV